MELRTRTYQARKSENWLGQANNVNMPRNRKPPALEGNY